MVSISLRLLTCFGVVLASLGGILGQTPGLVLCIGEDGHWALEIGCGPGQAAAPSSECPAEPGFSAITVRPAATCCLGCSDIPLALQGGALQTATLAKKTLSGAGVHALTHVPSPAIPVSKPGVLGDRAPLAGEQLSRLVRATVLLT